MLVVIINALKAIIMNTKKDFKITLIVITVLAVVSMSFKLIPVLNSYDDFLPKEVFKVTYSYFSKGNGNETFIKAYLPQNNDRQKISDEKNSSELMNFKQVLEENNKRGIWRSNEADNRFYEIDYSFIFKGKAKQYSIPNNIPVNLLTKDVPKKYLGASKYIETHHSKIDSLANTLTKNTTNLKSRIQNIFDYVYNIPSAPIKDVTSAVTTFSQNRASCNGKSRLFVALCRNQGIPARLVGGLILTKVEKRTSHLWAEVLIQNTWVPFDALNNHFGFLPANYLELYRGDHFLITRTPNILFDYQYKIEKTHNVPMLNVSQSERINKHPISLLPLYKSGIIPSSLLQFLLLLPLGGLLISMFKNVVGLKTYGIFLPILIAYALTNTGYLVGLGLFLLIVLLVALISVPLNKWGLLYTPKIVVILTVTVLFILTLVGVGLAYNVSWILAFSFFPIIITAITAERFARAIDEDGYETAVSKMIQTLIATSFCYLVFKSVAIQSVLLIFPELILIILAVNLLLGKWIGLRLIEYKRFKFIIEK